MAVSSVRNRLVFYAGDLVFAEGEEGNWAYLIQSGSIEIFKTRPDGGEHSLALLGAGRLFGEMALIDELPRMASARAAATTTLVLIDNKILTSSMEKADPLVIELIRNLSNNLRATTRRHIEETMANVKPEPRPYIGQRLT
jgi:CRP-like cAMP-binding protein